MSIIQDTQICMGCGEEYWYNFDLKRQQYTKLTMCKCDRKIFDLEKFLKEKDLLKEFKEFQKRRFCSLCKR